MEIAFSDAYTRILEATGCDGQADLAQELGIPQALISDSRRRGEIRPEILLALLEQFAFAPHWICTGEGQRHFNALAQLQKINGFLKEKLENTRARFVSTQAHEGGSNE